MACYYFKNSVACAFQIVFHCNVSIADFFFPLFPTGHGILAVIIVYKGGAGTLCLATACVFIYFLPFTYDVVRERS